MKKYSLLTICSLFLFACSGSDSSNPPKVAGTYACVSSCSGTCEYTAIVVTQNKSTVVAVNSFLNCSGEINDNGGYSATCEDVNGNSQSCSGTFAGDLFTAKCTIDGVTCQQAGFAKQ